ncbi:hypothetical protein A3860_22305 [Niastella vici]|uniref:DUF2541 domain-containing protein n=1 Tax=Niastella vici TaxID=1703345 RepID=A0A1V9G0K8_9BACT|nr:hypothetical protein [Niastella vici]OQP64141.1 hypothetical protein A3860_22305 [Niastella vici]
MKRIILLLLSTFLTLSVLQAQKPEIITNNKPGWHKIGDAKVDFKTDKDKFILLGKDKYKELQVKAKDAGVHIESMTVEYHGDMKEDIALKSMLKAGGQSRKISLKYPNLDIQNITFVYHTIPGAEGKKAEIELWGKK